ncbi:MAG TPA: MFS transporter [Acetobacteraceae bacterium]|nr:MFS transporter [Acetobacteraceae bacterium]
MANRAGLPQTEQERLRAITLTAVASLIGTTIEWYDFILYTSLSGLIFNKLFFPTSNPLVSLLLAYATFAVGFLTRPIGGAFFGHFGDRIGRKPLLVLTLTMMGAVTFLIGLVPTYNAIGIAAPLLMVALRLVQGFAMGGEWGGAVLMAFEYAPHHRRGFYASFPQIGFALGLCLSTGAITLLSGALSNEAFMAWGWRCAFLASIVLLLVGLFVRLKLLETPEFSRIRDNYHVSRLPLAEVARDYGGNIVLGWLARMGEGGVFTVYTLYMFSYLTAIVHLPRTLVLAAVTTAAFVLILTTPVASAWSDRIVRRRLFAWASLINGAAAFPLLWMLQSGNGTLGAIAIVISIGILWAPIYGPEAALFCELFDTRVRYTGVSLVYQVGAIIFLAPIPILAALLVASDGNQPWWLAGYLVLGCCVSALSAMLMRRTFLAPAMAAAAMPADAPRG